MIDLHFTAEVAKALESNEPVVALESTIITHGMPYPQNVEMARQVEDEIRRSGAVPATIAVIEGRLHIGLTVGQLNRLALLENVAKLSRADLAFCIATGGTGATTVAATMIAANLAGIDVFATGGIGGVHQGGETSFDVSADLQELAQTRVTVVCAGAKAILDIPKTLEKLESYGVPVIAYRQDAFPAFWSRDSGLSAPLRADTAMDIATPHLQRQVMQIPGGQLVANPVPVPDEIPINEIAPVIAEAAEEAERLDVTGKDVTPFMLQRIFDITEGRSLITNIALVLNNARLAAEIAHSICKIRDES
ncbi:MAG: pseudouridine-5'-phosphate glycosidase [Pseudomonadota bacterium]